MGNVTLNLTLNQDHVFKFFYKSFDQDTEISAPIDITAYTASFAAMSGKLTDVSIGGVTVSQNSAAGSVTVTIPSSAVDDFRSNNIRYFQVRLTGAANVVMASGKVKVDV